MLIILSLITLFCCCFVNAQVACQASVAECRASCQAQGDSVESCTSMQSVSGCVTITTCLCDGVFARCDAKCGAGMKRAKCSCRNGVDDIQCEADEGGSGSSDGLGGGAVAGIVIGVLVYCALCVGVIFFVWTKLPDADDEYDDDDTYQPTKSNNNNNNNNSNNNNNNDSNDDYKPSNSKYDLDDTPPSKPREEEKQAPPPQYGKTPSNPQYGVTPTRARDEADQLLDDILADEGMQGMDDLDAPGGYTSIDSNAQQHSYTTPATMASDVDGVFMNMDELQGNGDEIYGKVPSKPSNNNNNNNNSAADKKRAAAEAARARARQAVANRTNSSKMSSQSTPSSADADLKRRRQEILRKKKEELLRKKAAAARAAAGADSLYQDLPKRNDY